MNFIKTQSYKDVSYHHSFDETPGPFVTHCHDNFEIIFTLSGKGKYIVENNEFPLLPDTAVLMPPRSFHCVVLEPDVPYERYVFNFSKSVLTETSKNAFGEIKPTGLYFPIAKSDIGKSLPDIFAPLDVEGRFFSGSEDDSQHEILRLIVNELFLLLSMLDPVKQTAKHDELMARLTEFLNAHLCEDLSLDRITKELYISKYYLCRCFRDKNGYTLLEYITAKRIALAEHLLKKGEAPISVAFKVGYGDYSSFYRAFRKIKGCSPKDMMN